VNGYVEAGYAVVLATLALYAGRLVLRRRGLERWLPERPDQRDQPTAVTETRAPAPVPPAKATERPVSEDDG
jgi:hypothetical protein